MKYLYILVIGITLVSCSSKPSLKFLKTDIEGESSTTASREKAKKLIGKNLNLSNDTLLFSPRDIDVWGDTLLVTDAKGENLIVLFDLNNRDVLSSFDLKGYGPNEMMDATFSQFLNAQKLNSYDIT